MTKTEPPLTWAPKTRWVKKICDFKQRYETEMHIFYGKYITNASHSVGFTGASFGRLAMKPLLAPLQARRRSGQCTVTVNIVAFEVQPSHGRRHDIVTGQHTRSSHTHTATGASTLQCTKPPKQTNRFTFVHKDKCSK